MTDDQHTPTRQAIAARDRSAPRKVTGRLRAALIEMVWKGSRRAEAAQAAGMTDHSLRQALRKPHVKAWYLQELGVLRESERAKTFHRLTELRDQDDNKNAAVAAAKVLEQISDEAVARPMSNQATPGVTIRIVNEAPATTEIDVTPTSFLPAPIDGRPPLPAPEPRPTEPIFRAPKLFGR